jgi:hypothetical protein
MALIGKFTQQPRDTLDYDIVCSWLPTGDFVTAVDLSVAPAGLNVSYAINGRTVKIWAYGGTSGTTYKVTALVSSNGYRTKETEMKIKVVDE